MLERILDGSLMPHGHCLLWRADLLILHVGGDVLTALSYFIIPLGLIYLVYRRADLKFDGLFWLFAAFIFFCGLTHVIGLINIWHGYYFVAGVAKMATGLVSVVTAIVLWRLMPAIIAIPSKEALEQQNNNLKIMKDQLLKTNSELEDRVRRRTETLEAMARTDSLTGIYNRGTIFNEAQNEFARAKRYQRSLSIIMLDIDYFKRINDEHGHQTGDEALIAVAKALQVCCRESDLLGRYGGEEFLLICPETNAHEAQMLAERCRASVESLQFTFTLTISEGVAQLGQEDCVEALISKADQALYRAKDRGRNCVVVDDQ